MQASVLIKRESKSDKEFHFQNWFKARLEDEKLPFNQGGRNSYPDFTMVRTQEGFELKGLAYPGREASFDSNSQVPTGYHNEQNVYYVFGRYPKKPDGDSYPVMDLVICHGDFLNADRDYKHENKNVKGFGSYGDIMIRDRKMYVVATPFRLAQGTANHRTLILPAEVPPTPDLVCVGDLDRKEANFMVVGYAFDLKSNDLKIKRVPNPGAGTVHRFKAWRLKGDPTDPVILRTVAADELEVPDDDEDDA